MFVSIVTHLCVTIWQCQGATTRPTTNSACFATSHSHSLHGVARQHSRDAVSRAALVPLGQLEPEVERQRGVSGQVVEGQGLGGINLRGRASGERLSEGADMWRMLPGWWSARLPMLNTGCPCPSDALPACCPAPFRGAGRFPISRTHLVALGNGGDSVTRLHGVHLAHGAVVVVEVAAILLVPAGNRLARCEH